MNQKQIKRANGAAKAKEARLMAAQAGEIPADVLKEATDYMAKAVNLIAPYAETLTPQQRKGILKTGDKTLAFVTKGVEFCQMEPEYLTIFATLTDFQVSTNNLARLSPVLLKALQLASMISDTRLVNGSESFKIALDYYDTVKKAAKKNVPGAKEIYNELALRFPGRKKKKPEPVSADKNINEMHEELLKTA